jgi:GNAT superfamily N-acetyltransferase
MLIRAAHVGDVPALVPLFSQWGHEQPGEAIVARLIDWQQTPCAEVLVAELDGIVAGMAAVSASPHLARPGRTARLASLVVAATHRRRGVGTALLQAAENRARAWECDRLELTSSRHRAAAHAFYLAGGYEEQSDFHARYLRQL